MSFSLIPIGQSVKSSEGIVVSQARQMCIMATVGSRRPTIADVAKLCGVTPATVSRVLNDKKKFSTSEAVREKIWATARKLGYFPDLSARNLSRQNTRMIGLFSSPQTHVAEGINESLLEGMAEMLHAGGYDVFFEFSSANNVLKPLPSFRFDGAILLQAPKVETITELERRRVPYVCVNERVGKPVAFVLADDPMGARRAVMHLVSLGHKRLAYANARADYLNHYSVTERVETVVSVAKEHAMRIIGNAQTPFTSGRDFLRAAVIENQATAVMTYDHQIAVLLAGAASGLGLRIPEDFSLICFNDVFPVAIMHPPLTTVAVNGREMGRVGAEMLLTALLSSTPQTPREIRVPEDLIVRASTARPKTY